MIREGLTGLLVFGGVFLVSGLVFIEIPYRIAKRELRNLQHTGESLPPEPVEEIR